MTFDPNTIATYTSSDVEEWIGSYDEDGSAIGYIADQPEGAPMGLAFVRLRAGMTFDFAWPYDELSIVTKGKLTIRTAGRRVSARAGEILNQPRGVQGTLDIEEDLEMICVHHPTFAAAFGMTLAEYRAASQAGTDPEMPPSTPRGPEWAGGFFDPTIMQHFTIADVATWIPVDAEQRAYVGYIADQAEGSPMGIAFSDFRGAGVHELDFLYDEVAAITKGSFTVHSQGRTFRVRAGEMLYMPKGVSATFEIDEDTVAVGMHYPTFEAVMGYPPHQS
ncbi:cupin domain-containing protein [Lipingzhangella rawalii]|nr:cupin domain-containing protein [Lipingzhangella rawalii]